MPVIFESKIIVFYFNPIFYLHHEIKIVSTYLSTLSKNIIIEKYQISAMIIIIQWIFKHIKYFQSAFTPV